MNAHLLLSCAYASAELGDEAGAQRLERAEAALGMEGYQLFLDPLRARLALARNDKEQLEGLLEKIDLWHWAVHGHLVGMTTRLDVLVDLGRTEAVEEAASPLVLRGTYVEPFALRALGRVRDDPSLLVQAAERFDAMGLDWHAARTLVA
jgi:hypothetical protein